MMKKGALSWQLVFAGLMIFLLIVSIAIGPGKIRELAGKFNFFNDENATKKTTDIINLRTTINSLLTDDKDESYRSIDEFWLDKETAMVGFDTRCLASSPNLCPSGGTTDADKNFKIPKPAECGDKACICNYEDDGWGDTFEGDDHNDNFIVDSCITFDGDINFRASPEDPFNHGVRVGQDPLTYLVIFNGGTGGTNKPEFGSRLELFVQKTKLTGYTEVFISSRTSDVDSRVKYIDSLNK